MNWTASICASRWRPGSALFYSGSSTQVPLRYLYRGGLEQTGACSSLNAVEGERKEHKAHKTMVNCFWRCQTINWRAWLRCLRGRAMWPVQRAWRRAGTLSPIRAVVRGVMVFILYFKYNHGLKQCMTACLKAKISVRSVSTERILCEFKWFVFCGQGWIWHLPPGYCDRTTEGIW